jgi:hypothetical protein
MRQVVMRTSADLSGRRGFQIITPVFPAAWTPVDSPAVRFVVTVYAVERRLIFGTTGRSEEALRFFNRIDGQHQPTRREDFTCGRKRGFKLAALETH